MLRASWRSIRFDGTHLVRPNGGCYHADPRENFLTLLVFRRPPA
jgi:hypothetical protein